MIKIHDIIDAASVHLKEGTLVLHRSMKVHPRFRVYKEFCYNLYYVKGKEKNLLFSYSEIRNTPADEIDYVWDDCDKLYLSELIKWFAGGEYKSMLRDGI